MSTAPPPRPLQDLLVSWYHSGDTLRSRSVGAVVHTGTLAVPAPPARLLADWQRETALRLALEPGDVESLPLARARARWPDYKHCVQAMADWTRALGLQDLLADSDVALMACRGARYHHDGAQYGGMAFCNLFLGEDQGQDLHFASTGLRIPLVRGTAVLFDTCQPHAVIARHRSGFDPSDFPPDQDCTQVFLTWELPIENAALVQTLGIAFDLATPHAAQPLDAQVWLNDAPTQVCPTSGRWCQTD
jgi:hypothetical protein